MAYLNKVQIIGNIGADPVLRSMPDGTRVATVSVATTRSWKDRTSGEKKDHTEWHRVVFFKRLADIVEQYLKKGAQIFVEGNLRTRSYKDKDGIERWVTEIVGREMQMLGRKADAPSAPVNNDIPDGEDDDDPTDPTVYYTRTE